MSSLLTLGVTDSLMSLLLLRLFLNLTPDPKTRSEVGLDDTLKQVWKIEKTQRSELTLETWSSH